MNPRSIGLWLLLILFLTTSALATQTQVPGASTTEMPDLVVYNGVLYIFYNNLGSGVYYQTSSNGTTWSGASAVPSTQTVYKSPAAAVFNNKIYLCYRHNAGGAGSGIFMVNMDSGGNWSGETEFKPGGFGIIARGDPAIAAFSSKLYLAYTLDSPIEVRFASSTDGSTFGAAVTLPSAISNSGPAAYAFSSLLYIFWRNTGDANKYATVQAAGGVSGPFSPGGSTSYEPHATVHGSALYLIYRGASSNNLYTRFTINGSSWSSESDTGADSSKGPGGTSFGGSLWLTYKGVSSNTVYVNNL